MNHTLSLSLSRHLWALMLAVVVATGCHLVTRLDDVDAVEGGAGGAGGNSSSGAPVDYCNDGIHNNGELSVDCGGTCKACNGSDCGSNQQCKSGYCAFGTCRACQLQLECPLDDYCDEPTGICKPEEPEGATCLNHLYCQDHLYCEDGTCVPRKPEGSPCASHSECVGGLYCSAETCTPQKEGGEPCTFDIECLSLDCNFFDECAGA